MIISDFSQWLYFVCQSRELASIDHQSYETINQVQLSGNIMGHTDHRSGFAVIRHRSLAPVEREGGL